MGKEEIIFRGGQSLNPEPRTKISRTIKAQYKNTSYANLIRNDSFGASGVIRKYERSNRVRNNQ